MIQIVHVQDEVFGKISYYNKIEYKCEFKIKFFNVHYDERNAAVNNDPDGSVLGLDNVYVVYLMEKHGDGHNCDIYGHTIEYHNQRKLASKSQCNF